MKFEKGQERLNLGWPPVWLALGLLFQAAVVYAPLAAAFYRIESERIREVREMRAWIDERERSLLSSPSSTVPKSP
jgi:hypothetical protein